MSNVYALSAQIKAAFPALKVPGFRQVRLLKQVQGSEVEYMVIYDLNASQSPIYGIGLTHEEATTDLINRKAEGYAYLFEVDDSVSATKKIKELLWQYAPRAVLEIPEKRAVAVSSAVSRFDLEHVVKKLGKKLTAVSIF